MSETPDVRTSQVSETANVVPDIVAKYERTLNVEEAAALLMSWTDKQRTQASNNVRRLYHQPVKDLPQREFPDCPEAVKNMYRLLAVQVIEALGGRE